MTMPSDSGNGTATKKRRIARACDYCRRRKVKCDGDESRRCVTCAAANLDCTFLLSPPSRAPRRTTSTCPMCHRSQTMNHSPTTQYIVHLEERLKRMEDLLHKYMSGEELQNALDTLDQDLRHPKTSSPTHGEASATSRSPARRTLNMQSSEELDSPINDTGNPLIIDERDIADDLAEDLAQVSIVGGRAVGKSSGVEVMCRILDLKKTLSPDDPVANSQTLNSVFDHSFNFNSWAISNQPEPLTPYLFPTPDLLHNLVNLFFQRWNIISPVLHKPTFVKQIKSGLHLADRAFGANVMVVCAIGSCFSNDSRVLMENDTTGFTRGWKWFRQVQLLRPSAILPEKRTNLFDLQSIVLAIGFLQIDGKCVKSCWSMIGIGTRLAQEIGADRRKLGCKTVEDELFKRAWWALVTADCFMAAWLGRQPAVREEDSNQTLPADCDDEFWEHADPSQAFKQPDGIPSVTTCTIHGIRMARILGTVLRTLYCPNLRAGKTDDDSRRRSLEVLDSALNSWVQQLPQHLQWDPTRENGTFLIQSAYLRSHYQFVQVTIHRAFIPSPRKSFTCATPSLVICTNAARSAIRMLDALLQRGEAMERYPWFLQDAFAAGLTLLLGIWTTKWDSGKTIHYQRQSADVKKCLEILQVCHGCQHSAACLMICLERLALSGDTTIIDEPQPLPSRGQKRTLEDDVEDVEQARSNAQVSFGYPFTDFNSSTILPPPGNLIPPSTVPLTTDDLQSMGQLPGYDALLHPLFQPSAHPSEVQPDEFSHEISMWDSMPGLATIPADWEAFFNSLSDMQGLTSTVPDGPFSISSMGPG